MIRILQVVSTLKKNGTETFIINVFRRLNPEEIAFDFLVFDESKDGFYEEIIDKGAKVFMLPSRRQGLKQYHRNLDEFFKTHASKYDGVHFHCTSLTTLTPLVYAKKYGVKKNIVHIHGSNCIGLHNKILHRINRLRVKDFANIFLSCSDKASKWGYGGTRAYRKSCIIPNGIPLEAYRFNPEKRREYRQQLGLNRNTLLVIHVGMLHRVKNHKFLIDVIKIIKDKGTDVKLICVGSGVLSESLKEHVKNIGMNDSIFFLGHREDIESLLSASDVFVFPSLHEGFGLAVLEAQANGLPVVTSTALPNEVRLSDNFYTIDLKSGAEVWAKKIQEICANKFRKDPFPEIEKYSIENTLNKLKQIYTLSTILN